MSDFPPGMKRYGVPNDRGKVGVWTKADSVTLFDDFTYGAK